MTIDTQTTHSSDQELARIIENQSAGVETALRVFEAAEQVYYGAVAAMAQQETVTISASTKSQGPEAR
jgi:hypothetical protein